MARLASLPFGKVTQFMTILGNAGFTAELAEAVSSDRSFAQQWVKMAEDHFAERSHGPLRGLYDKNDQATHMFGNVRMIWDEMLRLPIENLSFDVRIENRLHAGSIQTVGDLLEWSGDDLRSLGNIGTRTIKVIQETLAARNLKLSTHQPKQAGWIPVWTSLVSSNEARRHYVPATHIGPFTLNRVLRHKSDFQRELDFGVGCVQAACQHFTVDAVRGMSPDELKDALDTFCEEQFYQDEARAAVRRLRRPIREWLDEYGLS